MDGDIATIGITDHAQDELNDIVYVLSAFHIYMYDFCL